MARVVTDPDVTTGIVTTKTKPNKITLVSLKSSIARISLQFLFQLSQSREKPQKIGKKWHGNLTGLAARRRVLARTVRRMPAAKIIKAAAELTHK
jgi:hypothetical protein